MNILVIAPTPYFSDRGCHIRIFEEAKALQALGHKPVIYTYHLGRTPAGIPVVRSANVKWYTKTTAGPTWFKIVLDGLLLWKILCTTKRRDQFAIIHAHVYEGGVIGVIVRWWLKCPLVLDVQSELVNELQTYGWAKHSAGLLRWFERWLMRRADWVIVSSDAAIVALRQVAPDLTGKLTLLRDGVSTVPRTSTQPANVSSQPTRSTIVYAGGMGPAKGFDEFLEACGELKRRKLDFTVLCIGRAAAVQKHRAAQLDLLDVITWLETVPYEQLLPTLQSATIGVDPKPGTSTEGSGKLLNYMAAGLTVVAYDSPSTRALVGDAGVFVTQTGPMALADTLTRLLSNPAERNHLAQVARQRIEQHFLWSELIKSLMRVYDRLA